MQTTWIDFCRESDMGQDSIPFTHDDWFNWLNYSSKHYQEPLILSSSASDWNDR